MAEFLNCSKKTKTLGFFSGVGLFLLFVGGPGRFDPRSYIHAWGLGHILVFSIWSYLFLDNWKRIEKNPFYIQCIWILSLSLVVGVVVELIQGVFGRTLSYNDVFNDLIGSLVALVIFNPQRRKCTNIFLLLCKFAVVMLILVAIFPFASALIDEFASRKKFPVLSDFEEPFEIDRWFGTASMKITHDIVRNGRSALRVGLKTTKASGVSLRHFSNDWRGFSTLKFSVYNTSLGPLEIKCKIFDEPHFSRGQDYDDRLNANFVLHHGWNDIEVSIEQIVNAPVSRKMVLSEMRGITLYVEQKHQPGVIYIDEVRLEKTNLE
jgi:VanZ family protein